MWSENKPNGKVIFREKFVDNLTEKEKTVSITFDKNTRETRSQAQKILLAKISKLQQDEAKALIPITFGNLATEWKELYVKQVRGNTILSLNANVKLLIGVIGSDGLVQKITPTFLTKKVEDLMFGKKDISQTYASLLKTRLREIFDYGISHSYLATNPVERVKIPRKEKAVHSITEFFLEDEELKSVMDYLEGHNYRYYLLCQWLYLNGLRFGEGAAMLKSDVIISKERQYCKVDGTLEYHGKKISEQKKSKQTKTSAGMREVELNSKAVEIYQEAVKLSPDSPFIFTTSHNTPIQINALNGYFRDHKETMGIDKNKRISTHIFRHTHVSKLAELELPLYIIQRRVGHSNEKITRDIYLHITSKSKDKTKKLLEYL